MLHGKGKGQLAFIVSFDLYSLSESRIFAILIMPFIQKATSSRDISFRK